ncbi:MAG TPA: hypothetical protein VN408_19845 [Actinoplanes sp.]|nr:hypothetical protein [Actinoplanes sp.]
MPGLVLLVAAGALLAGCEPDRLDYQVGLARVGDRLQVFTPLCPGEKVVGVRVSAPGSGRAFNDDALTWWRAAGPKAPAGPGEFLTLGVDEPFLGIGVPAGGEPPGRLEVLLVRTDLRGSVDQDTFAYDTSQVPSHPAGADAQTMTYRVPGREDPLSTAEIRAGSDCATGPGPVPSAGGSAVPGRQADSALPEGAAELVGPVLLNPSRPGTIPVLPAPPYVEDIASHVCANGPAAGAVSSAFGQHRTWQTSDAGVEQFAGVFGEVTAAAAVEQVEGMLGCGEYQDLGYGFRDIHRVDLAPLAGVDRQLMFCESTDEEPHRCTVLLARGHLLSRLIVQADSEEKATGPARQFAERAAAALS